MTTYALRVAESRRTVLPPLKAALVQLTDARLARFRALKRYFDQGLTHEGLKLIELDDPTPNFTYTLPDNFSWDEGPEPDIASVPEDFRGYLTGVLMPRLIVSPSGIRWRSQHFGVDAGVGINTATIPWKLLGCE